MNAPCALADCLAKGKTVWNLIESTIDLKGTHGIILSKTVTSGEYFVVDSHAIARE